MLGVFTANILDTKIVDDKGENDRAGRVLEKARGVSTLVVAMGGKVRDKGIICNFSSLGKAVHAFADLDINVAVMDKGAEVVLVKNRFWNQGDRYHHVFIAIHGIVEIEILDVHGHELGVGGGEDTVEEEFGGGEAGGLGADITRVVNEVATHSPADTASCSFWGRSATTLRR
jgi:hypothetical protein